MGATFEINTLEEMCDLMCDNKVPSKKETLDMSTKKEKYVVFKLRGAEILAYTVRGTFAGELENTKELLAAKYNCDQEEITAEIEERNRK